MKKWFWRYGVCRLRRKASIALTTANRILKPICALFAVLEECGGGKSPACLGRWADSRPRDVVKQIIVLCILKLLKIESLFPHPSSAPTTVINCAVKAETEVKISQEHIPPFSPILSKELIANECI